MNNRRRNKDAAVWLNGTRNKLSAGNHIYYNGNTMFTYVVPLGAGVSEVQLDFGKGDYEILDMECFIGNRSLLEDKNEPEETLYQSLFEGEHRIEIIYHAPGLWAGKVLACMGLLIFLLLFAAEKYRSSSGGNRQNT